MKHVNKGNISKLLSNLKMFSVTRPLQLLHMYLFRPTLTLSLGGKKYDFVIVDDC